MPSATPSPISNDLGATVVGISAQSPAEQEEFATREHIPFELLSDAGLALAELLRLPTFEVAGMTLYRRLTLVAEAGRIVKVFYPVFPAGPQRRRGARLAAVDGGGRNRTGVPGRGAKVSTGIAGA